MSFLKNLTRSAVSHAVDTTVAGVSLRFPSIASDAELRTFNDQIDKAAAGVGRAVVDRDKDKAEVARLKEKAAVDVQVAENLTAKNSSSAGQALDIAEETQASLKEAQARLERSEAFLGQLQSDLLSMRSHAREAQQALEDKRREARQLDADIEREKRRSQDAARSAGMAVERDPMQTAGQAVDRQNERRRSQLEALKAKTGAYGAMASEGKNADIENELAAVRGGATADLSPAERLARLKGETV